MEYAETFVTVRLDFFTVFFPVRNLVKLYKKRLYSKGSLQLYQRRESPQLIPLYNSEFLTKFNLDNLVEIFPIYILYLQQYIRQRKRKENRISEVCWNYSIIGTYSYSQTWACDKYLARRDKRNNVTIKYRQMLSNERQHGFVTKYVL